MDGYVAWSLHPDTSCQLLCPCSYQQCDEQQFQILNFFSNKARLVIQALLLGYIIALEKAYAYAVHASCCYIEINIFEHF